MAEKPHLNILHRELQIHDANEHYSDQIAFLQDLVNYGTNLIPAALVSSQRGLGDVIVITVLLKQVVRMLDTFEVLLSNACGPSAVLPARAAFEASIAIDWMLDSAKDNKATYYYVSNIRRQRIWTSRALEGDQERERFFDALGEFGDHLNESAGLISREAGAQLDNIDELLDKEPYKSASEHIEQVRGRRRFEPSWYEPLGIRSVRALADTVGRLHEYEIFYTQTSETMHSSWYKEHITIKKGSIELEPVRHLEDVASFISFIASVALHSYQKILVEYRPGQVREFSERYARDWRKPFLNVPNIKYKVESDGSAI